MEEQSYRRWQVAIEVAKLIATLAVAVALILFVQHPNSVLSKQKTAEELNRERARLLIDIISMDSDIEQLRAIEVLRYSYGDQDADLISQLTALTSLEAVNREAGRLTAAGGENANCLDIQRAITTAEADIESLRLQSIREEMTGEVSGTMPGRGPYWMSIRTQVYEAEARIAELRILFDENCDEASE